MKFKLIVSKAPSISPY